MKVGGLPNWEFAWDVPITRDGVASHVVVLQRTDGRSSVQAEADTRAKQMTASAVELAPPALFGGGRSNVLAADPDF